jgi:hypothetical protein
MRTSIGSTSGASRADQRGDLLVVDRHVDVLERLGLTVIEIEVAGFGLERRVVVNLHLRLHFNIHFWLFLRVDRNRRAAGFRQREDEPKTVRVARRGDVDKVGGALRHDDHHLMFLRIL